MSTFTSFLNVLPDPNYGLDTSGGPGAVLGQAFKSVKLTLNSPWSLDRVLTGNSVVRSNKKYSWQISITYNPMTKAQFTPINDFLMRKRGSLNSFYVSLPQYAEPYNGTFATPITTVGETSGGSTSVLLTSTMWNGMTLDTEYLGNSPYPGDMFNLIDSNNSLNTGTYMVTRVETPETHLTSSPVVSGNLRIYFVPRLDTLTPSACTVSFNNPLLLVTQKTTTQSYKLNNENLYNFNLQLEEASY